MNLGNFVAELRRRNVYRAAAAYCVVGWLVIQIATQVFPFFDVPSWGVRLVVLLIVIGLPVALAFSWAYEITPEGVKRTDEVALQKAGDSVRVNVQLIKADHDSHVWAETYDRKLTDIFAVESEIAGKIADSLAAQLNGRERQAIAAVPTQNTQAYDSYLRGIALL